MSSAKSELKITGIGSLPHHNIDAALDYSFRHTIPFLPQIPIRNNWEYMIPQALEGMPGIQIERNGMALINSDIWHHHFQSLDRRLDQAFSLSASQETAFENFLPSPAISSTWQAFLWELEERAIRYAKIQIAGPLTTQWALRRRDKSPADTIPGLGTQIYRLITARALAMVRALKEKGIQPLIFLDEPGLYAFVSQEPRHLLAFQELKLLIQTLRKDGALVGLHCCSDTNWTKVLELGLTHLSIDVSLSLPSLFSPEHRAATEKYLASGGIFCLGIIPTGRSSVIHALSSCQLIDQLLKPLTEAWPNEPDWIRQVLRKSIFTPACGLALHTVEDSEWILNLLQATTQEITKRMELLPQ